MKRSLLMKLMVVVLGVGCGDNIDASFEPTSTEPALASLVVAGAVGELYPAFDPGGTRYGVRIGSPAVSVQVAAADPLHVVLIDGDVAARDHELVGLTSGDVVAITVLNPDTGATRAYEIVALPADFPTLETTVLEDSASDLPLFVGLRGSASFVAMLDNHGVPYYFKREGHQVYDFKRHSTGEYSYALRTIDANEFGRDRYVEVVLNRDLEEIDRVQTVGLNHTDNHDFIIRPNGNYVLMAYNGTYRDMTEFGLSDNEVVEDSMVQEITRDREVVLEWSSWGHIPFGDRLRDSSDYAHANSVVVDTDGNLLLSARGVSRVIKIDVITGDVIWNLGGAESDFVFVDDPFANLCGQHTASRLASGNILIFDNGQGCVPEHPDRGDLTRIVEYELDESAMTATLVWSFSRPDAYSTSQGSAQRLANGNTLIGWGAGTNLLATEVDANGEIVFEMTIAEPDETPLSYRAWRFASERADSFGD